MLISACSKIYEMARHRLGSSMGIEMLVAGCRDCLLCGLDFTLIRNAWLEDCVRPNDFGARLL